MNDATAAIRLLTVCSHNRTRSVMIAAMLQSMLDHRLGAGAAVVDSTGFGPPDLPSIPDAVAAMKKRGLDISDHRSRPITPSMADAADLILTAEREHVVRVATMSRAAFPRAMTLPEFVERSERAAPAAGALGLWVEQLTEQRTTEVYLRGQVEEIADPTGRSPRAFAASVDHMEQLCQVTADRLAAAVR